MTRILSQKVPQIPLGACIVTSAVFLYTLTDKEPLLSSDSRRCSWIIYGAIPTHWLRKRHTPTEGRDVAQGFLQVSWEACLFVRFRFLFLCESSHFLKLFCRRLISHTFLMFDFFFRWWKTWCYIGHNATVHLTSGGGSKFAKDQANVNWWTVSAIHFHYAELPSPESFVNYPFKKCWTFIHAIINSGA